MRTGLWLAGAVCCGLAILLAATGGGGFGVPGGPIATQFSRIGFDALPMLQIFKQGQVAVALFLGGVVLMATATSTAWRETGGY
jgi:hypothetical protein